MLPPRRPTNSEKIKRRFSKKNEINNENSQQKSNNINSNITAIGRELTQQKQLNSENNSLKIKIKKNIKLFKNNKNEEVKEEQKLPKNKENCSREFTYRKRSRLESLSALM